MPKGLIKICLFLIPLFFIISTGTVFAATSGTINGCTYTINSAEAQPAAVTSQSTITITATVTQTGSGPACSSNNKVDFNLGSKDFSPNLTFVTQDFTTKKTITASFTYDLKKLNFAQLKDPAVFPYYFSVNALLGAPIADTISWNKTLSVSRQTGGGGNSGAYDLNIGFNPALAKPGSGNVKVYVNADSSVIANIYPQAPKVAILVYLNGKQVNNDYGPNNQGIDINNLRNNQTFEEIPPTDQSGFVNGTNNIRVDVQDAKSPYTLWARGSGILQGQGFGALGNGPSVVISKGQKSRYAVNDTFTITAQNVKDPGIDVYIGDTSTNKEDFVITLDSSNSFSYNFTVSKASGFNENGTTDLTFFDASNETKEIATKISINTAAVPGTGGPGGPGTTPSTVDCVNHPDPNYCLYNPLPNDSLLATLLLIMKGFLAFLGAWSAAFIVIGGFKLVISQGNEEAVTSAKKTITWAIAGFAIAVLSFSIMAIVQSLLQTRILDVSTKTSSAQINRIIA